MFTAKLQKEHHPLIPEPILQSCYFTVVIPVRNEAQHLRKTLENLSRQIDLENCPLDPKIYEIIFLVNNTTDESLEIIRRWQKVHSQIKIHSAEINLCENKANIGYIRRWLINEAHLRLKNNKFGGGVIATTDGDTRVAPNWIAATIAEIQRGAEAVGGRIIIDSAELKDMHGKARAFHLRDTGYRLLAAEIEDRLDYLAHDSFPRHHQHFNGSFAVTTAAFEKAGGIPEVRFLEDVAFYHALLRVDAKFRHSPLVRVLTSARRQGRTEAGLSTQINQWTVMGQNGDCYLVESAETLERRIGARQKLRQLWKNGARAKNFIEDVQHLADDFLIDSEFLKSELEKESTFGSLYEKILERQQQIGEWHPKNPLVNIEKALYDLRLRLQKLKFSSKFSIR